MIIMRSDSDLKPAFRGSLEASRARTLWGAR
jgi:hypothetical protein